MLISESTHKAVADRIDAQYLGSKQVKGKEHTVEVYEAFAMHDAMSDTGS